MTSICSECGATKIADEEPSDTIPATPETPAGYQRLATSNEPPNSAERGFLQAVASKTAVRLTCLDEEILRLKDRLGHLESERAQLAEYHSNFTDQKIRCYQQTYTRSTHDKSLERDVARPSKEDNAVTRTIGQQYLSSAGRVARTESDAPC
ncbi:hypothetical protein FB45DRAFT_1010712 [Roridomyces roridus]|uniref:Uncharacterized protein n=1 Tax=Roridomyces roridus TaxID=1738132 RepID=A0AAD7B3S3_9AGAR|nr:hypothetical protein FB45DRAFT_1010712 [Roridomyces roridus]